MFNGSSETDYQSTKIDNDGFWPNVDVGDFEKRRGLPAAQDPERIANALVVSMAEVNKQLTSLKAEYIEQGYSEASAVPVTPSINGRNRLVIQYEAAVFSRAKADLLPDIATVHLRKEGDHLAERSEEVKHELLAESERAIRNMCGMNRSSVTLL